MADLSRMTNEELVELRKTHVEPRPEEVAAAANAALASMTTGQLKTAWDQLKAKRRIEEEDSQRGFLGNVMRGVADGTVQIAGGIPLAGGLVDEGNALVRSGGGLWGNYDEELAYERERQARARERFPLVSGLNSTVGTLGGGAAMMPAKFFQGSLPMNIIKSGMVGGASGAVEGFTRGEGGLVERLKAIPDAAKWGMFFGGGAPVVGRAIGTFADMLLARQGAIPTVQAIKDASKAGYDKARAAGLVFKPETWRNVLDDISTASKERGIGGTHSDIASVANPTVTAIIDRLQKTRGLPAGPKMTDVEILTNIAADSSDPAAGMVRSKLKAAIDNSTAGDYLAGEIQEGVEGIAQGRDMWERHLRAQTVDNAVTQARNAAGASYDRAGYESALVQKFRAIADSDDFKSWPKKEQEAILNVVRGGGFGQNIMRRVGAMAPKDGVNRLLNAGLTYAEPSVGVPFALGTTAARMIASEMGIQNAKMTERLIKGVKGSPEKAALVEALTKRLLTAQSGLTGERTARARYGGAR